MLRYRSYAMFALLLAVGACKGRHEADAAGDVAPWTPPKPDAIAGVSMDAVKSAIQQRLTGAMPKGVGADTWRHVRTLYANYPGAPLGSGTGADALAPAGRQGRLADDSERPGAQATAIGLARAPNGARRPPARRGISALRFERRRP